ncbi:MAG: VOC family protein [Planctomycetes bacterium]|nr:VOC family protein [Planctomycetota bacterium]
MRPRCRARIRRVRAPGGRRASRCPALTARASRFSGIPVSDGPREPDRLWDALAEGGTIERCGWLRDRYGVASNIVPTVLGGRPKDDDRARARRATEGQTADADVRHRPAREGLHRVMKKLVPTVAGALLGLIFVFAGLVVLLDLAPEQPAPPEGSPPALFMGAFAPTGYLTFVKLLEVLGGLLVAVPRTRNLGLLVLGPIVVNILAFHVFIMGGEGLLEPMLLAVVALAAFLLWVERRAFAALVTRRSSSASG